MAPYCPHSGQARCGRCLAPHAGLAQFTSEGATAFHAERRCRVLLRDNFRFGTATVAPRVSVLLGVRVLCELVFGWCGSFLVRVHDDGAQRCPPGVDRRVVPMLRVVREPRATLDTQARAVVPAQRLERQC